MLIESKILTLVFRYHSLTDSVLLGACDRLAISLGLGRRSVIMGCVAVQTVKLPFITHVCIIVSLNVVGVKITASARRDDLVS